MRLAIHPIDLLAEINFVVVKNVVGAHFFKAIEFILRAGARDDLHPHFFTK